MGTEYNEKRKELRYLVEAGATVALKKEGRTVQAITVNMSGCGVLLRFDDPIQVAVGDTVTCDFEISNEPDKVLPYWGMGEVTRVDGCCVGIEFKAGTLNRREESFKVSQVSKFQG